MLQACILAHEPYEASTVVPLIDCLMRTHTKLASISKVYRSNMIFEFSQQNVENRTEEDLRTFDLRKLFCKTGPVFHLKEVFLWPKFSSVIFGDRVSDLRCYRPDPALGPCLAELGLDVSPEVSI